MNSALKKSLQSDLNSVRASILSLREREKALLLLIGSEGEAAPKAKSKPKAKPTPKERQRAPRKAMKNAILEALSSGPLTNGQIRAALKEAKYPYKVSPEAVRNVLQKLKTGPAPQIEVREDGPDIKYSLVKAKTTQLVEA